MNPTTSLLRGMRSTAVQKPLLDSKHLESTCHNFFLPSPAKVFFQERMAEKKLSAAKKKNCKVEKGRFVEEPREDETLETTST